MSPVAHTLKHMNPPASSLPAWTRILPTHRFAKGPIRSDKLTTLATQLTASSPHISIRTHDRTALLLINRPHLTRWLKASTLTPTQVTHFLTTAYPYGADSIILTPGLALLTRRDHTNAYHPAPIFHLDANQAAQTALAQEVHYAAAPPTLGAALNNTIEHAA